MKKVLVIEGDITVINTLEVIIKELNVEFSGSTRLMPIHEIVKISPNVMLIDHRMPFGFGGDLCQELKTDPRTSNIKVILTSTYLQIAKVARENFADGYLHKPFDREVLMQTVSKFLDQTSETESLFKLKREGLFELNATRPKLKAFLSRKLKAFLS